MPEGRACPELVAEQALGGFHTADTSNLEPESDGFEETQVRLRLVVPHPCVSKTGKQKNWGSLSLCWFLKGGSARSRAGLGRLAEQIHKES